MTATEPPAVAPPARPAPGPLRRLLWSMPLGWQLSVLYTVLLALTLAVVGTVVYTQQEAFLLADTTTRLETAAQAVMSRPAFPGPPNTAGFPAGTSGRNGGQDQGHGGPGSNSQGPGSLSQGDSLHQEEDLIRGLSGRDVSVAVLDSTGTVLTATQVFSGESPRDVPAVTPAQAAQAVAANAPVTWVSRQADGSRQVIVLMPIAGRSGPAGAGPLLLEQAASLAAVDAALNQLRTVLLLGVLFGTLAGLALGIAFTRAVLRPLDRVTETAEAIAAGDLGRRLRLPSGRNEVARLGHTFDTMVGRLVASLEAQRRFVADASHELRTPLTSLKGLAEILVIGAHGNDSRVVEQAAGAINGELERLIRLVNDLLTLSRFDSTGGHATPLPRRTRMDACATLGAAVAQMGPLAEAREVRLRQECAATLWVLGDAGQLKQVLLNLLDNALRFTPPGGEVAVRAVQDGPLARLEVRDTGVGIAPQDLPHVFERFYRGDASRTRATGNSGLGLAIVKTIVEAHEGEITAESTPGAGTCFTIRLPLADAGSVAEEPAQAHSAR